jgi:hypothetical protein
VTGTLSSGCNLLAGSVMTHHEAGGYCMSPPSLERMKREASGLSEASRQAVTGTAAG